MGKPPMNSGSETSLSSQNRQLMPEIIDLDSEYFEEAAKISNFVTDEAKQWQLYLDALALFGFEQWVSERNSDFKINKSSGILRPNQNQIIGAVCNLQIGKFKICLVGTDNLTDQEVEIPKAAIEKPEFVAHFYVVIKILVEQEQAILQGILRYDKLIEHLLKTTPNDNYQLSLSWLDPEPDHLLLYVRYLEPAAIPLPSQDDLATSLLVKSSENLSRWFDNIVTAGWQTWDEILSTRRPMMPFCSAITPSTTSIPPETLKLIEQLYISQSNREALNTFDPNNPIAALTDIIHSTNNEETRFKAAEFLWEIDPENPVAGVRNAKDLGMQLGGYPIALLVAILNKPDGRIAILVRVHPMSNQPWLPEGLRLVGLDETGESFFEVKARKRDDYIQFKLTADPGDTFSLRVALGDDEEASVTESFIV